MKNIPSILLLGVLVGCSGGADRLDDGATACSAALCKSLATTGADQKFQNALMRKLPVSGSGPMPCSEVYFWPDFVDSLAKVVETGINGAKFYLGDDKTDAKIGMINAAAFIAQSMQETIQYDACDENNWSVKMPSPNNSLPAYPLSAACGQEGQSYGELSCSGKEKDYECPEDNTMQIMGGTHATWWGAPMPMFCAPKEKTGATPRWNSSESCQKKANWLRKDKPFKLMDFSTPTSEGWDRLFDALSSDASGTTPYCEIYEGQQGGWFTACGSDGCPNAIKMSNLNWEIKKDVEGCCWWGRGIIQTTGRCNIGLLNYALNGVSYPDGKSAKRDSTIDQFGAKYDFCKAPEKICTGDPELKWLSGLFYWVDKVQTSAADTQYQWPGYQKFLKDNAEAIFSSPSGKEGAQFINAASGLVNRGCPASSCSNTGPVDGLAKRQDNFLAAMCVMQWLDDSTKDLTTCLSGVNAKRNVTYTSGDCPIKPGSVT